MADSTISDPGFKHPKAACIGATHVFFLERGESKSGKIKVARDTCARCPVLEECKRYVLRASVETLRTGIWAGMTEKQARNYRRTHRIPVAAA